MRKIIILLTIACLFSCSDKEDKAWNEQITLYQEDLLKDINIVLRKFEKKVRDNGSRSHEQKNLEELTKYFEEIKTIHYLIKDSIENNYTACSAAFDKINLINNKYQTDSLANNVDLSKLELITLNKNFMLDREVFSKIDSKFRKDILSTDILVLVIEMTKNLNLESDYRQNNPKLFIKSSKTILNNDDSLKIKFIIANRMNINKKILVNEIEVKNDSGYYEIYPKIELKNKYTKFPIDIKVKTNIYGKDTTFIEKDYVYIKKNETK